MFFSMVKSYLFLYTFSCSAWAFSINLKSLVKLSIHMELTWLVGLLSSFLVFLLLFGLFFAYRMWKEPIE